MKKKAIIHIGLHKTGTTSIQHFLQDHRVRLQAHGFDFYQGMVFPENHVELHVATMRPERESGYKNRSKVVVNDEYIYKVRERVRRFIRDSPCDKLIFSNEGLSLLRYADELERLRKIIPVEQTTIVVYLRNVGDYLRSYANQIRKDPKTLPGDLAEDSFANTKVGTWLANYEQRLLPFKKHYGTGRVVTIDYDRAVKAHGSVLNTFLFEIGAHGLFEKEEWDGYFYNRSV